MLPPLQGGDQWQHSEATGNPGGVSSNFTGGDLPVPQVSTMLRLLPRWSLLWCPRSSVEHASISLGYCKAVVVRAAACILERLPSAACESCACALC